MEDIDAAFSAGLSRDAKGTELEDPRTREARRRWEELGEDDYDSDSSEAHGSNNNNSNGTQSRITLSGLLNALDGVSAQEERTLCTTDLGLIRVEKLQGEGSTKSTCLLKPKVVLHSSF